MPGRESQPQLDHPGWCLDATGSEISNPCVSREWARRLADGELIGFIRRLVNKFDADQVADWSARAMSHDRVTVTTHFRLVNCE